ncbi:ankyrin repeat domain-containing protein 53 [Scyliorhinus canicula]|uniref:ankyrin repeat domain-containing protein 53 n=1 Tax=Scyliorhinus canicula TaxID=7830 RepID=UPI0018F2E1BD|nr:ankyrin repeat domain-containing protein 53 [Scyliorhinus canicula]
MTGKVKKWNRGAMLSDELMAATVGDADWLRLSLNKAKGKIAVDQNGYNAVHLAARNGRLECLKVLVEDYNMDVNLANPKGWSPIHLILNKECQFRALKCLKYLLSIGADPNVQTNDGLTPLHQAAEVGLLNCIIALVEAGADVMVPDSSGHRPHQLAKIWCHRGCARYLANAVWEVHRSAFFKQTKKLQELKFILLMDEKYQSEIQQEEKESLAIESFRLWRERKHLSNVLRVSASFVKPRQTVSELMVQQLRDSVKIEGEDESKQTFTLVPFPKPRSPCRPKGDRGSEKSGLDSGGRDRATAGSKTGTCAKSQQGVCQAKPSWNFSTTPTSLPMAGIYGQIQADADNNLNSMLQQHNFGILFELALDRVGQPLVRSKVREKTWSLPTLSLDVVRRELFPDSIYHRLRMPSDFKAVNVIDLPKKRRLVRDKSEIDMHLREWLEPNMACLTSSSPHSTRKVESISPGACAKGTSQPENKQHLFHSGTKCQSLNLAAMDGTALAELKECRFECRDRS